MKIRASGPSFLHRQLLQHAAACKGRASLVCFVAVALSACGGSSPGSGADDAPTQTATPAPQSASDEQPVAQTADDTGEPISLLPDSDLSLATTIVDSKATAAPLAGRYVLKNICANKAAAGQYGSNPWDNIILKGARSTTWDLSRLSDGSYILKVSGTGSVLQTEKVQPVPGTTVNVYTGWNGPMQRWLLTSSGNGRYALVNAAARSQVLTARTDGYAEGAQLTVNSDTGSCSQRWTFTAVATTTAQQPAPSPAPSPAPAPAPTPAPAPAPAQSPTAPNPAPAPAPVSTPTTVPAPAVSSNPLLARTARILCLGDSMTAGDEYNPASFRSYRGRLYTLLAAAGHRVDFVGTSYSMPAVGGDPNHDGYGGAYIGPGGSANNLSDRLPGILATVDPDIVILAFGWNSVYNEPSLAGPKYRDLVNRIAAAKPNAHLVVATLSPPRGQTEAQASLSLTGYAAINAFARSMAAASPSDRIHLADYAAAGFQSGEYLDVIHWTQAGADRAAQVLYRSLVNGPLKP